MSILPNNSADAIQAIKEAVKERIVNLDGHRKVYTRFRYADNLNQWLDVAGVVIDEKSVLRVIFIYISDIRTEKKEARQNTVTLEISLEIVFQFNEGSDADNSTLAFETEIGNLNDIFRREEALGFTDASSSPVINTPLRGITGEDARPQYVDGVLAHRKILTFDVSFRLC